MPLDITTPEQQPPAAAPEGPTVRFADEMGTSYLRYGMSVIISRALPDGRDGLKPVHRRILFAMEEGGYTANKPTRKSARIVGDVMGKYHPHGDSSIYDAMARMAQPFSLRVPLIDGQGNFGSMDGDPPAAMRYTEARLARAAEQLTVNIDENTVDFRPNYDESSEEPTVLPTRHPNLLINGADGIAVGMATKIPPHNPVEAVAAAIALANDPGLDTDGLMQIIQGPDFPTGGIVMGRAAIRHAYETGRASVTLRGVATIENVREGRSKAEKAIIVITEIPYQVNRASLAERIGELAERADNDGIPGIADVRDESDEQTRLVVEVKRDGDPNAVLASLYRMTPLQISYPINIVALEPVGKSLRPAQLSLKRCLEIFLDHRREVIRRRSEFRLARDRRRLHIQVGLLAALDMIDEVVRTIRRSESQQAAKEALCALEFPIVGLLAEVVGLDPKAQVNRPAGREPFLNLTEDQAKAILDMKLSRLTRMDGGEVAAEAKGYAASIVDLIRILNVPARAREVLLEELEATKAGFKPDVAARRTQIEEFGPDQSNDLATIPREDVLVTLTTDGYIKRVPMSAFRSQKRGGMGRAAAKPGESQAVTLSLQCTTHAQLLAFTAKGMCYAIPVHTLPASTPQGKGRAIVNFCEHLQNEQITAVLPREPDADGHDNLIFIVSNGDVRRNAAADFAQVRATGKIAMRFAEEDSTRLIAVLPASDEDDVMLFTAQGSAIRFAATDLRVMASRESTGVRGINLGTGDAVVGAAIVPHGQATPEEREAWTSGRVAGLTEERKAELAETERFILTVSENGFGKRSSTHHFRITNRGGKGVTAAKLNPETGPLVAALPLADADDLMVTTAGGVVIRQAANGVARQSRDTRGLRLIRLEKRDIIQSVMRLDPQEEEESEAAAAGNAS